MEDLLENPHKVTPRLLFELYTFNYQRTLFEKLLNDKIDDAIRKNKGKHKAKKDIEAPGSTNAPNLSIFVELLNIFDEKLLSDNSFFETRRREWVDSPDAPIMEMEWILPENWKAEEKAFRKGEDENEEIEPEASFKEKCGKAFVIRELAMWSCLFNRWELVDIIRDHVKNQEDISSEGKSKEEDQVENLGTVLGVELGIAVLIHNCHKVTQKYITLSELQSSYKEQQEKIEDYTVHLIESCYEQDYDQSLLLIRVENRHWGKRTALQLAEQARLSTFMSTDAVQDLLDKIWTGGLEPTSSFRLTICSICPLLVPLFMKESKDPYIDRIKWMKSGFFWTGKHFKSTGMSPNEDDSPRLSFIIF
ncbi:unnamed protein product [Oikopleura dioica]|uniref:TRPM-like domain-containing protein n=1 Tax=Oikopleura dioica TaxID=34765 RepID=E4X3Q9_OIKDI|nr:unnamed protein product [Oikopleura dioica]